MSDISELQIRPYIPSDYPQLKNIYEQTSWFDPETDSEERLARKVIRDPSSMLIAALSGQIVGSVRLIEDETIAWLFRLVTIPGNEELVLPALIREAKAELKRRGYNERHIFVREDDRERQKLYSANGFQKGNTYTWMYSTETIDTDE